MTMTPKQALQILDSVSALAPINRVDQQNTQIALDILAAYIDAHEAANRKPDTPVAEPKDDEPQDHLKIDFNPERQIWKLFNGKVIEELKQRIQPHDFICVISGRPSKPIADAFPEHMTVEVGIGYTGVYAPYKVFESYAWEHY